MSPLGTEELAFLIELARTVQRYGMYPEGHPSRASGAQTLMESLAGWTGSEQSLTVGVEPDRLVIGEEGTDPDNGLLAGLAQRLYEHQIMSLIFRSELGPEGLQALLAAVAQPVGREGEPLGGRPPEERASWTGIEVRPVPFESLSLAREGAPDDTRAAPSGVVGAAVGSAAEGVATAGSEPADGGPTGVPGDLPDSGETEGKEAGGPTGSGRAYTWVGEPEPERILKMSLEVDETAPLTRRSVTRMIEEGHISGVIDLLEGAPVDNTTMVEAFGWVARPRVIRGLLAAQPPDLATLDRLIPRLGEGLAGPLLDVVDETDDGEVRSQIEERLIRLGSGIGPLLVARLSDQRSPVRLTALRTLARLPERPTGLDLSGCLGDADPEVRKAALGIGSAGGVEERRAALKAALRDPDPGIARFGIEELVRDCPSGMDRNLVRLVEDRHFAPPVRQAGIRAMTRIRTEETRQTLVGLVWERRFLWFYGLRPKGMEMMEGLSTLARAYAQEPRVQRILQAARRSRDGQVRALVGGGRDGVS